MSVTATFEPSFVSSQPGAAAALTLRLHNDADAEEVVRLKALGELADHTVLQSETIYLEPGEEFELPVIIDVSESLSAGPHVSGIEVAAGDGAAVTAEATIDVVETASYSVTLAPSQSSSASTGKHRIGVHNAGNVPITIDLAAAVAGPANIELAAPVINVDPGKSAQVELKVHPQVKFWTGPIQEHHFDVHVVGSDSESHELNGIYNQGPRLRPWFLPALVGMLGSLILGTLAWFALVKPSVESIADDRADAANETDQTRLDDKILELEAAAQEAKELPLGTPVDLRLTAEAAPGGSATETFAIASDRVFSMTDVVFQNPDGSVGRVALLRNGDVLLESELANFRDLDFHFVAPFRFDRSDTVEIRVECETPGPNSSSCIVGMTYLGFIDAAE